MTINDISVMKRMLESILDEVPDAPICTRFAVGERCGRVGLARELLHKFFTPTNSEVPRV